MNLLADVSNPLAPKLSPSSGGNAIFQFSEVLKVIINVMFMVGIVIFVVYFLIGGIQWITSSGDSKSVEKARNTVIQAVIGLVVLLSLFAILKLVELVFGISILQIDIGRLRI